MEEERIAAHVFTRKEGSFLLFFFLSFYIFFFEIRADFQAIHVIILELFALFSKNHFQLFIQLLK